jgi:glycosyltransferase involved in cell wall biosynthesis
MTPSRALLLVHRSPPVTGAALMCETVVGALDQMGGVRTSVLQLNIRSSSFVCRSLVHQIGHGLRVVLSTIASLLLQRPDIVYFTPALTGNGVIRDLTLSALIRLWEKSTELDVRWIVHFHQDIDKYRYSLLIRFLVRYLMKDARFIKLHERSGLRTLTRAQQERAVVIPNGVSKPLAYRTEFDSRERFRVLFLSNLLPAKGVTDFLDIVRAFSGDSGIRFDIIGAKGPELISSEVETVCSSISSGTCVYHGPLYGEARDRVLSDSDLLVFPSKDESFGLVVVEALAAGVPVLGTDVGAVREIVGDCGYVIPADSTSETLCDTFAWFKEQVRERRSEYARMCSERYQRSYTKDRFLEDLIAFLFS